MKRFMYFIRRVVNFIRTRGLRGATQYIDNIASKVDVFAAYGYIVDETKVPFDIAQMQAHKNDSVKLLNWVIPEMGVGSGGHINIFRFVSNLENMGFHSRIYLQNAINLKDNETLHKFVAEHFSILDSRVETFCDISYMTFAHATIATGWQTAYAVKNFDNTISKFYFVQDFEPYFYAMGSEYVFAENTYKMGFRGITAGDWLKNKLSREYGMQTSSFGFSYDKELYRPIEKKSNEKRVFFYARPVTPRRDFELGLLALDILAKKVPDLTVVFAGWDVGNYEIPFKHENLGIRPLDKLCELYASCDMCFIISNTNLSLLPLEVMASGSVAVCSKDENSTWLVNDENAVMVEYDANLIAEKMAYYLNNPELLAAIRQKGIEFAQNTSWIKEAEKVKEAILKGIVEDEEK